MLCKVSSEIAAEFLVRFLMKCAETAIEFFEISSEFLLRIVVLRGFSRVSHGASGMISGKFSINFWRSRIKKMKASQVKKRQKQFF